MKIFVTGATGFLGSALTRIAKNSKHQFLFLSHPEGDISKPEELRRQMEKFGLDAIIHLAWENVANYNATPPDQALRNFQNSLNLYRVASKLGVKKFIVPGSINEHSNLMNPFLASKLALRNFGEALSRESPTQFLWVRPFYIYGPGQRKEALLPSIINTLLEGGTPDIKNPLYEQDFIYVDDVAKSMILIAERSDDKYQLYEVGRGQAFSIGKLANIAYRLLGIPERYSEDALKPPTGAKPLIADTSLVKSLGWEPQIDYEEGISEMIRHFKADRKS